jgi:menaquinone-dependent protoporphyrinogen IX oxidase
VSGIIVYRTSSGSTRQYAEWIGEETGFGTYESRDPAIPWDKADTIVIGSPIIANRPVLAGWVNKHWDRMKGKRVALFTVSAADPLVSPAREWAEGPFSEEMRSAIGFFPLAGWFDYAKLGGAHKAMIWIAAHVMRNQDVKNQIKNPVNGVAKENLDELLAFLQETG